MDWLEEQEESQRALDVAFTVLNEGPPPLSARQLKAKKPGNLEPWADASRDLILESFPELYPHETKELRIERAEAFDNCWWTIKERIRAVMESTDAAVFSALLKLAKERHLDHVAARDIPPHGLHRIPTGLVLAGGVNSADHIHTFPTLAAHLRSRGCYVALLSQATFSRSLSDALNSTLRQFSGESDCSGDQFEALAAWHADEIGAGRTQPPGETSDTGNNAEETNRDGIDASSGRILRARAEGDGGLPVATAGQLSNRGRPLVVIVESTEAVPPDVLEDLVTVLSEGYALLPVTLVLGLTTTAAALQASLPSHLLDRALDCHSFNLASAMHRLDTLVSQVLLSKWTGLLLDRHLVAALWEHFLVHYFSPSIVVQGWKVAALDLFRTNSLAVLAFATIDGDAASVKTAVAKLHGAQAAQAKKILGISRGGSDAISDSILSLMNTWRLWSLAIHWMVAAAAACGLSNGYTYWQLYRDALAPGFGSSGRGKELLGRLNRFLSNLEHERIISFAETTLVEIVENHYGYGTRSKETKEVENAPLEELHRVLVQAKGDADCGTVGDGSGTRTEISSLEAEIGGQEENNQPGQQQVQGAKKNEGTAGAKKNEGTAGAKKNEGTAGAKKNERFFSKASRKAALMIKSLGRGSAVASAPLASGNGGAARGQDTPSALISNWLTRWLASTLQTPPTAHPASNFFTCCKGTSLDCLSAAPREAIHNALVHPESIFRSTSGSSNGAVPTQLGVSTRVEDACIAYQLFDQDPNYANVADWFIAFKDVHTAGDDEAPSVLANTDQKNQRNKGKAKGKGKGAKGKGKIDDNVKNAMPTTSGEISVAVRTHELAARFSQAAAELQFVGLLRPTKRRRGDHVQRAAHMPASLMGE